MNAIEKDIDNFDSYLDILNRNIIYLGNLGRKLIDNDDIKINLKSILHIIDVNNDCINYIDNYHTQNKITSFASSIGCDHVSKIYKLFDGPYFPEQIKDNLNIFIKEYIEYQISKNKDNNLLKNLLALMNEPQNGGNAKVKKMAKKEILGRERCIYKKAGDRKEYLKHKGELITVKDYKKRMKVKK